MAVNLVSYLSNITKSITYAAIDKVEDMTPSLSSFKEDNEELGKELYAAIKDFKTTAKKVHDWAIKTDVYEAADIGFHAIAEDIRTGKFYNKERIDEMNIKAGGSMTDYSDITGDPFAEIDGLSDDVWNDDDSEWDLSDDTKATIKNVDEVGSKVTNGLALATTESAEMISKNNWKIAGKNQRFAEFMTNKISIGMGAVNSTIAELVKFNIEVEKPYIDTSIKFYNDSISKYDEIIGLLKNVVDNQNKSISPLEEKKKREKIGWNEVGTIPSIEQYGKVLWKNIQDQSMGMFNLMDSSQNGGMGNILAAMVASPLQFIPETIVNSLVPKMVEKGFEAIDKTLEGAFGAFVAKMNGMAFDDDDDNIIGKFIGKIFGISSASKIKNTAQISGISERAIPWDQQSKFALTRLIPDYLAKIVALQSQTSEKLFDYSSGKYETADRLAERYDTREVVKNAALSATKDYMAPIRKVLEAIEFEDADQMKAVYEALNDLAVSMYRDDNVITPEFVNNMISKGKTYKLKDKMGIYDDDSMNIIASIIANMNAKDENGELYFPEFRDAIKTLNMKIFNTKQSEMAKFERLEENASAVTNNLYNGYGMSEFYTKDADGSFNINKGRNTFTEAQKEMQALDVYNDTAYSQLGYVKTAVELLADINSTISSIEGSSSGYYNYIIQSMPTDPTVAKKMRDANYNEFGLQTEEDKIQEALTKISGIKGLGGDYSNLPIGEQVAIDNYEKQLKEVLASSDIKHTNEYVNILYNERLKGIQKEQDDIDKWLASSRKSLEEGRINQHIYDMEEEEVLDMFNVRNENELPDREKSIKDALESNANQDAERIKRIETVQNWYNELGNNTIRNPQFFTNYSTPIVGGQSIPSVNIPSYTGSTRTAYTPRIIGLYNTHMNKLDKFNENAEEAKTKAMDSHNERVKKLQEKERSTIKAEDLFTAADEAWDQIDENMSSEEDGETESMNMELHKMSDKLLGMMKTNGQIYRREEELRKQKEKEKQINPENVIKKLLNIKEEDENMSNFLTGLKKLTDKPAEFLGGVLRKVDDRLYAVLFGEKDDDKLSPKSFMNQLSNRLGLVFRDFRGFMKDEIYEPLKSLFTGEDSIVHTAKKAIEDTFDVNFSDLNKDVVEFIFGKKDEKGNRYGGMFGDKMNWARASVKEVTDALGDMLVETPDGTRAIDMQKFLAARDEYYDTDVDENGNKTGYKISEIQNLLYGITPEDFINNIESQNKLIALGESKGWIDEDTGKWKQTDLYKEVSKDLYKKYANSPVMRNQEAMDNLIIQEYMKRYATQNTHYKNQAEMIDNITNSYKDLQTRYEDIIHRTHEDKIAPMSVSEIDEGIKAIKEAVASGKMTEEDAENSLYTYRQFQQEHYDKIDEFLSNKQKFLDSINMEDLRGSGILGNTERLRNMNILENSGLQDYLKYKDVTGSRELFKDKKDKLFRLYNEYGGGADNIVNQFDNPFGKSTESDKKEDNEVDQAATGGQVKKTGIVALSEGELVIPAKYNPFYHGNNINVENSLDKESDQIDKFLNSVNYSKTLDIPQYAAGSTAAKPLTPGLGEVEEIGLPPDLNDPIYRKGKLKQFFSNATNRGVDRVSEARRIRYRNKNFNKLSKAQQLKLRNIGFGTSGYEELTDFERMLFEEGRFDELLERFSAEGNRIADGMEAVANDVNGESFEQQKKKLFDNMVSDLKDHAGLYLPSSIGGAVLGGGVSLITGAVGGPLLGAAVGAAADIAVHSNAVQDWLFGEEYIDRHGNTKRKGNILSADIANNVNKYFPDMAKGAVVGGITSILPFVPGGPVAGVMLGSAIGFAKNNDYFMTQMFGTLKDDGTRDNDGLLPANFLEKLRGVVPDATIGALAGGLGGILVGGPFGLMGNMALGAGIGLVAQTDRFKEALFGKEDPATGVREGGLLNSLRDGFVTPLIDTGKDFKERFTNWFKEDIAKPISDAIAPLKTQGWLLIRGIADRTAGTIDKVLSRELGGSFTGFGQFLKSKAEGVLQTTLNVGSVLARPAGKIISSPFRAIGRIGEHLERNQVADGNATYMTAKQRLQYRQELDDGVYYKKYKEDVYDPEDETKILHHKGDVMVDNLGRPIKESDRRFRYFHNTLGRGKMKTRGRHKDKFKNFDETLTKMNLDDLDKVKDSLEYLANPSKGAEKLRDKAISNIENEVYNKHGFTYKEAKKLLTTLKDGGMQKATRYINKLGLPEEEERNLKNFLTQQYSTYLAVDESKKESKTVKDRLLKNMQAMGFEGLNNKTIQKHLDYVNQEIDVKEKSVDPIQKLNDSQKERHSEIVNLFNVAIDQLRAINDKDYAVKLAEKEANRQKRYAETRQSIFAGGDNFLDWIEDSRHGMGRSIFNYRNSGALWGPNYEMAAERDDKDNVHWFMVNKSTGERIEVNGNGQPVNEEDKDKIPTVYKPRGIIRGGLHKAKEGIRNSKIVKEMWSRELLSEEEKEEMFNSKDRKLEAKKEGKYKDLVSDLFDKFSETALAGVEKEDDESWEEFYNRAYQKVSEYRRNNNIDTEEDDKESQKKIKEINDKYKRDRLKLYGFDSDWYHGNSLLSKLTHHDKNNRYVDGQQVDLDMYYKHAMEAVKGEQGSGNIVGEEVDDSLTRRTIADMFGNPVQLIRDKDGRWIRNPADSENREADTWKNAFLNSIDNMSTGITSIKDDIKDGFAHFFGLDKEEDGWLKKSLKIGGAILGTLTAASAIPAAEALWTGQIKPQLALFWEGTIAPKLNEFLSPVKPTIAKAAVGIDMAIRSVPRAIDNLGDRIRTFITGDLPGVWSTRILPFYQNGYNWMLDKVEDITEMAIRTTFKTLPHILIGAGKGLSKFLMNDIFSLFGGYGRTDSSGIFAQSVQLRKASSVGSAVKSAVKSAGQFEGASNLFKSITGESAYDYSKPTDIRVTQSDLENYYENTNSSKYPATSATREYNNYAGYSSVGDTFSGYDNNHQLSSGTLEDNFGASLEGYTESIAASSYSAPSSSSAAYRANNELYAANKKNEENAVQTRYVESSYTNNTFEAASPLSTTEEYVTPVPVNKAKTTKATVAAPTTTYQSEGFNPKKLNIASVLGLEKNAKVDESVLGDYMIDKTRGNVNTYTTGDNGYNYYNPESIWSSGSSAGISLYNASYDPTTGLVYSSTGQFIPNAFFDPETGGLTDTPTDAALQMYPDIMDLHDNYLQQSLNSGDISYENLYGKYYNADDYTLDDAKSDVRTGWDFARDGATEIGSNVREALNNDDSILKYLTKGMSRARLTGSSGVAAPLLKKMGKTTSKTGIIRRVAKTPFKLAGNALDVNAKHLSYTNTASGLVSKYQYNRARNITDTLKGYSKNLNNKFLAGKNQYKDLTKLATEAGGFDALQYFDEAEDVKSAYKAFKAGRNNIDDVVKNVMRTSTDNVVSRAGEASYNKMISNIAKNSEPKGLFKKIISSIKGAFSKLIKSAQYEKAVKAIAKSSGNISTDIVKRGLQEGNETFIKGLEEYLVKKASGKAVKALAHAAPIIADVLMISDFVTGFTKADDYMGLTTSAFESLEHPVLVRVAFGIANLLCGRFLLGLVPMPTVAQLYINIVAPLLGISTEDIENAQKESAEELEKWIITTGDEDASIKDMNNYNSWYKKLFRAVGIDLDKGITESLQSTSKATINSGIAASKYVNDKNNLSSYTWTDDIISKTNVANTEGFKHIKRSDSYRAAADAYAGNGSGITERIDKVYGKPLAGRAALFSMDNNSNIIHENMVPQNSILSGGFTGINSIPEYSAKGTIISNLDNGGYLPYDVTIRNYGAGSRTQLPFNQELTSVASMRDLAGGYNNSYAGRGSGIAGKGSGTDISYIVNYYGGSTSLKEAKKKLKKAASKSLANRGADIVSESARLIIYLETKGNMAFIGKNSRNKIAMGAGAWSGREAAYMLRMILKIDSKSSKKLLGTKLYNKIAHNSTFNKNTYTDKEIKKIKWILATEEGRKGQATHMGQRVMDYIKTITSRYSDPKVVIFMTALYHQFGQEGFKYIKNTKIDDNLETVFDSFRKSSTYKKYASRYNLAYQFAKDSSCTSTDISSMDTDAIEAGIGINKKDVEANVSGQTSSSGSSGFSSSGDWIADIQSALSAAFMGLFGIGSSGSTTEEGVSTASETDMSYGDDATSSSGSTGSDGISKAKDSADVIETVEEMATEWDDTNYNLSERLLKLQEAYSLSRDKTIELFSQSDLLALLLSTTAYQEWIGEKNNPGASNKLENIASTGTSNDAMSSMFGTPANNKSNPKVGYEMKILAGMVSVKDPSTLELTPKIMKKTFSNIEELSKKVFREFARLANNKYAFDSVENFHTAYFCYMNAFIADDKKAVKLDFHSRLKYNKSYIDRFKRAYGGGQYRKAAISFMRSYYQNEAISDYANQKFNSKFDNMVLDLSKSFQVLSDSSYDDDKKEVAWDTAAGIMADWFNLGEDGLRLTPSVVETKNASVEVANRRTGTSNDVMGSWFGGITTRMEQAREFDYVLDENSLKTTNKFRNRYNNEKYKSYRDIIEANLAQYPTHDFDALLGAGDASFTSTAKTPDLFQLFNIKGAIPETSEASMSQLMVDQNGDTKKVLANYYTDDDIQKYGNQIIQATKERSYKVTKANYNNPYTLKRLVNESNLEVFNESSIGQYYKAISDLLIKKYLYGSATEQDYNRINQMYLDNNIGGVTRENELETSLGNAAGYQFNIPAVYKGSTVNNDISNFSDYFNRYLKSIKDSKIPNESDYSLLDGKYAIDKGIADNLPKEGMDIKIGGKDINLDNYVYADALNQQYAIDKADKKSYMNKQSAGVDKLGSGLRSYLNFENRKGVLQLYKPANLRKGNVVSLDDLLPTDTDTDNLVPNYFNSHYTSSTTAPQVDESTGEPQVVTEFTPGTNYMDENKDELTATLKSMLSGINGMPVQGPMNMSDFAFDANTTTGSAITTTGSAVTTSGGITTTGPAVTSKGGINTTGSSITPASNGAVTTSGGVKTTTNSAVSPFKKNSILAAKGSDFISQLDYKDMRFSDGESMAEAGCGPAVAAMAINGLSGGASMAETASIADKYKTSAGTDARYFNDVFSKAGAKSTYYEGSTAKSGATKSLKAGQQVVLLGQDSANKSKSKSPFGPGNHYVLAKGMANGKIAVNDPEQHGTKLYDKTILNNTKLSISVGKGSGLKKSMGISGYAGKASAGWSAYPQSKLNANPKQEKIHPNVKRYKGILEEACIHHGVGTEWVDFLMAMMNAESHGGGKDPMQAAEGVGNSKAGTKSGKTYPKKANGITDATDSCYAGVYELKSRLKTLGYNNPYNKQEILDIAQGYNFGNGYSVYLKKNGIHYTLENAVKFGAKLSTGKYASKGYGTPNHALKVWAMYITTESGKKAASGKYGNYNAVGTDLSGNLSSSLSTSESSSNSWIDELTQNLTIMGQITAGVLTTDALGGNNTSSSSTIYTGSATPEALVKIAEREIGNEEHPKGSNKTKYGEWYGMNGTAWCAIFVSYCFGQVCGNNKKQGGKLLGGSLQSSVDGLYAQFKKVNAMHDTPKVGDVVIYKNSGASHAGIVVKVNNNGTFDTVEGNSGSGAYRVVKHENVSLSNKRLTGFGRPQWNSGSGSNITEEAFRKTDSINRTDDDLLQYTNEASKSHVKALEKLSSYINAAKGSGVAKEDKKKNTVEYKKSISKVNRNVVKKVMLNDIIDSYKEDDRKKDNIVERKVVVGVNPSSVKKNTSTETTKPVAKSTVKSSNKDRVIAKSNPSITKSIKKSSPSFDDIIKYNSRDTRSTKDNIVERKVVVGVDTSKKSSTSPISAKGTTESKAVNQNTSNITSYNITSKSESTQFMKSIILLLTKINKNVEKNDKIVKLLTNIYELKEEISKTNTKEKSSIENNPKYSDSKKKKGKGSKTSSRTNYDKQVDKITTDIAKGNTEEDYEGLDNLISELMKIITD